MSWGLVRKSMCDESIVVLIVIYASLSIILSVKTSIVYILSDAISRIKCPGMSSLKCCWILCLFVFTGINRITKTISLFPSQKTGQCLQQLHINAAQKLVNSRWISLVLKEHTIQKSMFFQDVRNFSLHKEICEENHYFVPYIQHFYILVDSILLGTTMGTACRGKNPKHPSCKEKGNLLFCVLYAFSTYLYCNNNILQVFGIRAMFL